jgi:Leucine-rich repeat (LRR) protein
MQVLLLAAAPQVLNMARNSLTALPPEISCLSSLTELDVGRNQLAALPPSLCSLSQLQVRLQNE